MTAKRLLMFFGSVYPAFAQQGPSTPAHVPEGLIPFVYIAMVGLLAAVLLTVLISVMRTGSEWTLAGALTEEGKPSTSRLIAFLGFSVIIAIYYGIGLSLVYRLLTGQAIGDVTGLGTFLAGAAAVFAPYIANQVKAAVQAARGVPHRPPGDTPG